jgi:hypothetical protein
MPLCPSSAVAGDGFALVDVKLSPLSVELGLGDIVALCQSPRIGEALAEHGRDEDGHMDHHNTHAHSA